MILTHLQKLPKNGEDWGKLIVAKDLKNLPKVQNIAQSGHMVDRDICGPEMKQNNFLLFHFQPLRN